MPSDPAVKRTPDLPDDRSLCFASKPYRQRHDLPRTGVTVTSSPRSSGILPSVAPSFPPGPAVPSSTRERETQGPPWSKLAASRQSPVRASVGWHKLTRKQVDRPRTLALLYTGCHCTMPNRTGQEANKKPAAGGFFGRLWTTLECLLVPRGGIEPPRCFHRRILSPLRLPIPPSRLWLAAAEPEEALIIADSRVANKQTGAHSAARSPSTPLHQPAHACSRSTILTSTCPAN